MFTFRFEKSSLHWIRFCLALSCLAPFARAFSSPKGKTLSIILQENYGPLRNLRKKAASSGILSAQDLSSPPYDNNVFFLRFCLEHPGDEKAQVDQLHKALEWRQKNRPVCDAALRAYQEATTSANGAWNNDPVLQQAPFSKVIAPFLLGNVVTSTIVRADDQTNDLLYCIRAGFINDKEMMQSVTKDQLVEFFLYVKEIHHLVANDMSLKQNQLVQVITANDLTKVQLVGGSADFRQALSQASQQSSQVYPHLNGPTLLLNLPRLLNQLVSIFTVLFPASVKKRLKFGKAASWSSLTDVLAITNDPAQRKVLLEELNGLLEDN